LALSRRPVALPAEVDAAVAANQDSGRLAGLDATHNEAAEQALRLLTTGDDVIYLYDKGDHNFGYAVNVQDPYCSEWGSAPFS
jgi:hypothetical protein